MGKSQRLFFSFVKYILKLALQISSVYIVLNKKNHLMDVMKNVIMKPLDIEGMELWEYEEKMGVVSYD